MAIVETRHIFDVLDQAEKAERTAVKNFVQRDVEITENVLNEVSDEICCDKDYEENVDETEEVDIEELARDKLVEKVTIFSVTKPIEKKEDVEAEIRDKFAAIGVKVKQMKTRANYRGEYEASLVDIRHVNLNKVWGLRSGLKNCRVIAYEVK